MLHKQTRDDNICMCQKNGTERSDIVEKYTVEQARGLAKISQKRMSVLLGMSENAYINKEKGETRFYVDEALKFSNIVGIPFENIIFCNVNFFKKNVP